MLNLDDLPPDYAERLATEHKNLGTAATVTGILLMVCVFILGIVIPRLIQPGDQLMAYITFSIAGAIGVIYFLNLFSHKDRLFNYYYDYLRSTEAHRVNLLRLASERKTKALYKLPNLDTAPIAEKCEWIRTIARDPNWDKTHPDAFSEADLEAFFTELEAKHITDASRPF